MIGLSLAECINDIVVRREVDLSEVEKIITATCCKTRKDWDQVIDHYRRSCWRKDPDECERVARVMIGAGMIEQPRLIKGGRIPSTERYRWVTSPSQIEWVDVDIGVEDLQPA